MKILKNISLFVTALAVGLTMTIGNAEAARVSGGKSVGMQRQMAPVNKPATATTPQAAPAPGMAAAQPKRSWMGPIAGLAAGLGLAALASHFGFGEELANIMMIALLAFVVMAIIGFLMRKRSQTPQRGMAGAGAPYNASPDQENPNPSANQFQATQSGGTSTARNVPVGFDTEAFIRNAKVGFIRLQAAHDAGDLADIREFTSPEMFAEIRMDLEQRNGLPQKTDIISLNADILEATEENHRYIVSVRFSGSLREEADAAPLNIDEIWHLTKPVNGQGGWVLAGIQQVQ